MTRSLAFRNVFFKIAAKTHQTSSRLTQFSYFAADTHMPMITTRKGGICALLIFTMEDPKEPLIPMVNGKSLLICPMSITPKAMQKATKNIPKHRG